MKSTTNLRCNNTHNCDLSMLTGPGTFITSCDSLSSRGTSVLNELYVAEIYPYDGVMTIRMMDDAIAQELSASDGDRDASFQFYELLGELYDFYSDFVLSGEMTMTQYQFMTFGHPDIMNYSCFVGYTFNFAIVRGSVEKMLDVFFDNDAVTAGAMEQIGDYECVF